MTTTPPARPDGSVTGHRNRAAEYGLRQTSTGSCPRRLVRRPHLGFDCWCATLINDHGRRYRIIDDRDTPVVLWEPYNIDGTDLAEVLRAAADDGLRVHITGASPWYPGRTVALLFVADGTPDDHREGATT